MRKRPSAWLDALVDARTAGTLASSSACGAELVLADTVGAIAGGARAPAMRRAAALLAASADGACRATLIGPERRRAAPDTAAFVNAMAGCWLEVDEGIRPTGHPGVHVVPAALAVAESVHASGERLLAAVAAGYEVAAALFEAFEPRHEVHPHGTFGAIGAAIASATLLDVDPVAAAATAASAPLAPMWSACLEGATSRNGYAGNAASLGVRAAYLAAAGLTPSAAAFDDAFGSLLGAFREREIELATASAAPVPAYERNYFKLHSACVLVHSAIDAALEIGTFAPGSLQAVEVCVPSRVLRVRDPPAPNELSIRFSLPYAVAVALLRGRADERDMVVDETSMRLAQRIVVTLDPELDAAWPSASPARVTVRTGDGERTVTIENHRGHHLRPPRVADLRSKFARLAAGTAAEGRFDRLREVASVTDVAELL